ncbi:GAF domain-containing SpoIIE family protein phosphatase [Microbacterium sp.]|uniref:PP2C family protein-serine/threonine phosphatase n=1 Tax=Microbacterium sp. TaxID=51671 RepID=UPI002E3174F1|nr:GAF domain-containing SpoIIE family protein phosphatase [Microbacterium sp.]HEX5730789.1 GAF domain-containing SpoIIE family protein phosphatase [Microbacterium sp.]
MVPPASNDARLAALNGLKIMGTPPEERFDRITRMARELFGVPMAEIHLLDETTLFTKSPQPPGVPVEYPREGTFCDATLRKHDTLVIPDLGTDDEFATHVNVAGPPFVRFYAGRPLSVDDGQQIGTICLLDLVPRELTSEQERMLDAFGRWVERELRDTAERDRAAELQDKLLPRATVLTAGYRLSGLSIPLHQIAGDFYNWRVDETSVDLTVVDVMGKGAGAAILAAGIRSAFGARTSRDPADVVAEVNAQLADDFTATGTFATLFHGRLDPDSGRLDYVDSGHGLALLVRADGEVERLASVGLPIGIAPDADWLCQSVHLNPGDALVAFTDGLLDLFDGTLESVPHITALARASVDADEFFGLIRRLAARGGADDDVTVLMVTRP